MSSYPLPIETWILKPSASHERAPYHPFGKIRIAPFGKGGLRILAQSGYRLFRHYPHLPLARPRRSRRERARAHHHAGGRILKGQIEDLRPWDTPHWRTRRTPRRIATRPSRVRPYREFESHSLRQSHRAKHSVPGWGPAKIPPFQVRSATGQHRRHGGVSGGGKGRGQGL